MFYFRNKIKLSIFFTLAALVGLSTPPVASAKTEPAPAPVASFLPQTITVVTAQVQRDVNVSSALSAAAGCTIDSDFIFENLQAVVSLNLNQPAQCFTVALHIPEVQSSLTMASPPIYTLGFVNHSSDVSLQHSPELAASLPQTQLVMLSGYTVEYQKSSGLAKVEVTYKAFFGGSTQRVSNTPSLSMLSILRC